MKPIVLVEPDPMTPGQFQDIVKKRQRWAVLQRRGRGDCENVEVANTVDGGVGGETELQIPCEKGPPLKSARQLLEEFTASSFRDPRKAAEMFSEDGTFEMPYLESLGFAGRYSGRTEIEGFFEFVRVLYPDMEFHDVKIVCESGNVVVAEYEFTTRSSKTGRTIHQLFVGRLESHNGKIKLLRESINLVELGLAIYANGLADYKVPVHRRT